MDANIVTFYRLINQAPLPERADRAAGGTLPTRAFRYCDAVTSASAFGWWLYSPMDFELLWDGSDVYWHYTDAPGWLPLRSAAQFPRQAAQFDDVVPEALKGCSPPFLTLLPEPGSVQIWTGMIARTVPGWSVLVRAPANLPTTGGYVLYEGIVETDFWFGPLFTNLRLTRTNVPVRFSADMPLAQVQPIPQHAYADATLETATMIDDITALDERDWNDFHATVVASHEGPNARIGSYAVAARRRRKGGCPFSSASANTVSPQAHLPA
jgi:hypothetical protein